MKMLMLAAALLLSTAWLQAQDQTPPPQDQTPQAAPQQNQTAPPQDQTPPTQDQPAAPAQDQTTAQPAQSGDNGTIGQTVEGCLQNSGGTYSLTDASGKTFQLQGPNGKLGKHVGHVVRVTGAISGGSMGSEASPMSPTEGQAGAHSTLSVDKLEMVSRNCNKNGMSK